MKRVGVFVAFALSLFLSDDVLARENRVLAPSSKWQVDYGTEFCSLARVFGTGDEAVVFLLKKFGPGDSFSLTFAGKPMLAFKEERPTQIQFGPNEDWQDFSFFAGKVAADKPAVFSRGSLAVVAPTAEALAAWSRGEPAERRPVEATQLANVKFVSLKRRGEVVLQLITGPLAKPFAEMDKCLTRLVESWGFDPSVMANLKSPPRPLTPAASWLKSNDYPRAMIALGKRALVNVLMAIDATGKVTSCRIQQSTRPVEFDEAVCRAVAKRAAFSPAIAADGKAVPSYWRSTVIFTLP